MYYIFMMLFRNKYTTYFFICQVLFKCITTDLSLSSAEILKYGTFRSFQASQSLFILKL